MTVDRVKRIVTALPFIGNRLYILLVVFCVFFLLLLPENFAYQNRASDYRNAAIVVGHHDPDWTPTRFTYSTTVHAANNVDFKVDGSYPSGVLLEPGKATITAYCQWSLLGKTLATGGGVTSVELAANTAYEVTSTKTQIGLFGSGKCDTEITPLGPFNSNEVVPNALKEHEAALLQLRTQGTYIVSCEGGLFGALCQWKNDTQLSLMWATIIALGLLFVFVLIVAAVKSLLDFRKRSILIRECSYGDAVARSFLRRANTVSEVQKFFHELPRERWDHRYFYALCCSRVVAIRVLEKWVAAEPDSAEAYLVLGARQLQSAWEARGYGKGKQVTSENAALFFKRLSSARSSLENAARLNALDPTPWCFLIVVSTWESQPIEQRQHCFQQAVDRDPESWPAHMSMVVALCKKWGGSHEQMFHFARSTSQAVLAGSDVAAIIVKAHIEYWKYVAMFDGDTAAAKLLLADVTTQQEVVSAYDRSLDSGRYKDNKFGIFLRYNFSGWFWLVKDKRRLAAELTILGSAIEDVHWRWVGAEGELKAARDYAGVNSQK